MNPLTVLTLNLTEHSRARDRLQTRASGRFYTHNTIGSHLVQAWVDHEQDWLAHTTSATIADPFCGDGRLLVWAIEAAHARFGHLQDWQVHIWDIDEPAVELASRNLARLAKRLKVRITVLPHAGDAFSLGPMHQSKFDAVLTNPPWEQLKPDARDLRILSEGVKKEYIAALKAFDSSLSLNYPNSQPKKKFAGWGTNLARAGTELALKLVRPGRIASIVSPASLFADESSVALRRWLLTKNTLLDIAYFPAELRLFEKADVTTTTVLLRRTTPLRHKPQLTTYSISDAPRSYSVELEEDELQSRDYVIPVSFGLGVLDLLPGFNSLPAFSELEGRDSQDLWAGREVDETRISEWFTNEGGAAFLKGKMVGRFHLLETTPKKIALARYEKIKSVDCERIVWRDVSRPNQKRRMVATLASAGWVTGNSLGVAYFRDNNGTRLRALLGFMNSFPFELQLRARLATGHVSLTSLRKVRLPRLEQSAVIDLLVKYVELALGDWGRWEATVEATAAHAYGLSAAQLSDVISEFPKVSAEEKDAILTAYSNIARELQDYQSHGTADDCLESRENRIFNHYSARLSGLDLDTARSVPPGGNWKDVPVTIPLKRLETIRQSYARGEGSRSTYYGRLHPNRPSYTINTYFSRPGNGCHLHYDFEGCQHRVISQREAARFQTFPDDFEFHGSKTSINQQIGNAVPPLLSYRIAKQLPGPACFIDLFSGAGGLGLGFLWAGWKPILGNEIDHHYIKTYKANVHSDAILGDIRSDEVLERIIKTVKLSRRQYSGMPLWVLGGPPCQGFSTAGKRRSVDDERNHLFKSYVRLLDAIEPDGFVFENVPGLLNMQGGSVFRDVMDAFRPYAKGFGHWVIASEEHAVPQRRKRVILIGMQNSSDLPPPPPPITSEPNKRDLLNDLASWVTAAEALGDLPRLEPGQDGSNLQYFTPPRTAFQAFMRGLLSPEMYLERVRSGVRDWA